jgi:hypothetical protein
MFDKCVRGLASQGWEQCVARDDIQNGLLRCSYSDGEGRHCAWGWIDTDLKAEDSRSIYGLWSDKIGVAGELDNITFAEEMQKIHDRNGDPDEMKRAFIRMSKDVGYIWPADVPK